MDGAKGVPVIDIAPLLAASGEGDAAAKAAVAAAIRGAAFEWGFFYVTGYTDELQAQVDGAIAAARAVFDLPEADKASLAAKLSPLHRGWTGVGGAHNCSSGGDAGPDLKESFLLGAEGSVSPMHGPNPWPSDALLPGWAPRVRAYFSGALDLSRAVARGLALALQLPEAFFEARMRDPVAQLLLLRYPPAADAAAAAAARARVGCGEHTDCGFLTILAQDDVPGLEVRTRGGGGGGGSNEAAAAAAPAASCGGGKHNGPASCGRHHAGDDGGAWVPAPPRPRALLINLGDLAAFWSGGALRSTPHRVNIPPGAEGRARHSVVFFCNCDFDAEVRFGGVGGGGGGDGGDGDGGAAATDATTAGRYILKKLGLMWE